MRKDTVLAKMGFIMTKDELERIKVSEEESGDMKVQVDLHELHKKEAKRFIGNILGLVNGPFRLKVIHGYNNGTVLKEYVNDELQNKRIQNRYVPAYNQGITILNVA